MASTVTRRRPLVGEPVAVDLLNTRWVEGTTRRDLLDGVDGLRQWLGEAGLDTRFDADVRTLDRVLLARGALAVLVDAPEDAEATARLNEVLDHGFVRRRLRDGAPAVTVEFDDPAWGPAWTAAADYLDLLDAPDRIRGCANPACVLHFFDTSRNGTRRWCSMSGCGNRAKAARHHARAAGRR
ncbi:CGNR zinc finger domain-containing protein [Nocardiopsis sp. FIRDI 009]|uniref:CGNR zinc finger domain-containing protein n=1 Tax=Nocardiopsis sp. FIRDI 009 TaxID=714197 RepID=UPI000E288DF4|nr:CGNR zinc finger domain-containing protein [Nocardiopsis sp. FIRDI 009]